MGREVVEITSSGNVGLYAPGALVRGVVIDLTRRTGKAYLNIEDLADAPFVKQLLDFLEVG